MIEVFSIDIHQNILGIAHKYVIDIRLVDRSSGIRIDGYGFNYDKRFTLGGQYLGALVKKAGNLITEYICG